MSAEIRESETNFRVLHLINGEYFGGSARVLINYLGSSSRRADVAVGVFFHGELEERLKELGVDTYFIPMRSRRDFGAVRIVRRVARKHGAQIIHSHQLRNTLVARLASVATDLKVITHIHSPALKETTNRVRNVSTYAVDRVLAFLTDRFVCVSQSMKRELVRNGVPAKRISVVYNGIPFEDFPADASPTEVRSEFGIASTEVVIGMVANFRPRKGAETLLHAVRNLKSAGLPVHLLLVGEPFHEGGRDYGAVLKRLIDALELGQDVSLIGFRSDVGRVLRSMDMFVLPSLFGEGMPMTLLEAMASGIPVISTPVEGIPEVLDDGRYGVLVSPGDVEELTRAIEVLVKNSARRAAIAEAARTRVASVFSADAMASQIEEQYRLVLGGRLRRTSEESSIS